MKNALSIFALASLTLLTACGGGGAGSGYGTTTSVSPSSTFSATAFPGSTAVDTASVTFTGGSAANAFVTATSHEAIYIYSSDTANAAPTCTTSGGCLGAWPAVAPSGTLSAGFGTVMNGSTTQLTYQGHPLYTFAGDTTPGVASGQNDTVLGGNFFLATAAGSTTATPGAAPRPY